MTSLAISISGFLIFLSQYSYGQVENWQTYLDPEKRFTLYYPPGWQAKGKENMFSSIDLMLTNPNSTRPFQITVTYIVNDSSLNYTGNEIIIPQNDLLNLEDQLKPAYKLYNVVRKGSPTYILYDFPTASNIIDYTKHNGETGRVLNVLGIVTGKSLFLFSYSNSKEAFYKSLPIVKEIMKSVVILK
jgi:hypothetical protein